MSRADDFGHFQELVFLAVLRLGSKAYGAAVRREIAERTQRDVDASAVFTTLDRLEAKGYLSSVVRDGVNINANKPGPNPRRYFTVEAKGVKAFNKNRAETACMMEGLRSLI